MKLRVWYIKNFPGNPRYFDVASPEEGADKINEFSRRDLHDPNVISNAMGMEVFDDGEWSEWYDEEGNDIDTLAGARW